MNPTALPLEDIILPEAIGAWPLAWGWWLVIVLSSAAVIALTVFLITVIKNKQRTKKALKELESLLSQAAEQQRISQFNYWLKLQLKKQLKNQEKTVLALHGKDWLNYLNHSTKQPLFENEIGQAIAAGQYQKIEIKVQTAELMALAKNWYQHKKGIL